MKWSDLISIELLSEVISDYTERIKSDNKNVKLIYDQKDTNRHILVEADKGRITQVLSNILNNALKFTNEGQIIVDAHENNDKKELIVSITDTGSGINRDVLLQSYFPSLLQSHPKGIGLGLYISKSIIEAHGGRIWDENNKEKIGSILIFTLPIVSGD